MKKLDKINRLIALGALCVGGAAALAGCGTSEEEPTTLYGPADVIDSLYGSSDKTEDDINLEYSGNEVGLLVQDECSITLISIKTDSKCV